jgi:hypothetical protein
LLLQALPWQLWTPTLRHLGDLPRWGQADLEEQ